MADYLESAGNRLELESLPVRELPHVLALVNQSVVYSLSVPLVQAIKQISLLLPNGQLCKQRGDFLALFKFLQAQRSALLLIFQLLLLYLLI